MATSPGGPYITGGTFSINEASLTEMSVPVIMSPGVMTSTSEFVKPRTNSLKSMVVLLSNGIDCHWLLNRSNPAERNDQQVAAALAEFDRVFSYRQHDAL